MAKQKVSGSEATRVEKMIDARKLGAIVWKNWLVIKADPTRLVMLFMFPIVMIVIFGYAMGNMPKHLPAAIVDYDQTPFSHSVSDQISAIDVFSIKYMVGTQDEGKRLIDDGKIKVLFILPQGLEDNVAGGKAAQIGLMVDESDSSVAQISKSTAQVLAQSLSSMVARQRLAAVSAQASGVQAQVGKASSMLAASSSSTAATDGAQDAGAAYMKDIGYTYSKSSAGISATVQATRNSLGYLVDQNELVSSYSPSSMGTAVLASLATGDSQQAVLQQIGFYQGMQGAQAKMYSDAMGIYGSCRMVAAQAGQQQAASQASIALLDSAGNGMESITSDAGAVMAPVEISIIEPYGYGRRAIDFLLPSILAMIIFQGASMGLGRAIAGERKDGSLTRVFLTPTSNVTIILGTQIFYLLLETVRSSLIIFAAMVLFGVSVTGSLWDIVFIICLFSLGATGIGMVLSVLTKTQEQYMALGMLISMPMMFLSGAFFPIQTMPAILQAFAQFLPITYASDALRAIMVKGFTLYQVVPDITVLAAFGIFTLTLTLLMFKRELV